jgi:ABC-type antimicrobial peptide transport system permease subunit
MLSTVLLGGTMGIVVGLFSARFVAEVFYQVRPTDLLMLAFPSLAILAATSVAPLPAALRATRIDPTVALRFE